MNRRGFLTATLGATLGTLAGVQPAAAETIEGDVQILGEAGRTLRLVSGTLRSITGTWAWISDTAHCPSGVLPVTQTTTSVILPYSFKGKRVSSLQVTPDETFAAMGLRVGASVGLDKTVLYLYNTNPYLGKPSVAVNPSTIKSAGGNLWVTGYIEV